MTNTAARLTAIAQAGDVLGDAETYDAVRDLFSDAKRYELELKGKQTPVEAFLISAAATAENAQAPVVPGP